MIGLSNNKEFLRMSIFFLWLINISGFFGILSDQNEFFLSTTPYVLSLTLLLLILNHDLSDKIPKNPLMLISQRKKIDILKNSLLLESPIILLD